MPGQNKTSYKTINDRKITQKFHGDVINLLESSIKTINLEVFLLKLNYNFHSTSERVFFIPWSLRERY